MEGGGALLSHSNIFPPVCQPGPTHTQGLRIYRSVLEQWGGKYAQRNKNTWSGLELETSWLWYQLGGTPLASPTIKPRWYRRSYVLVHPIGSNVTSVFDDSLFLPFHLYATFLILFIIELHFLLFRHPHIYCRMSQRTVSLLMMMC
jgi:hypothetical protein